MILGRREIRIDAPILGMHDFKSGGTAPHFAETADARAAREPRLLLRREVKESQREEARAVADLAEHLPAAAKQHLRQQHLAFDRGALPGPQFSQGREAGAVLVAQRQQEQQVLGGLDAERAQLAGQRIADAAQYRDRSHCRHNATMHSTSTCAPRGSAATPTAARAG